MKLHMAKKYQDSMMYNNSSRGGCKLKKYKEVMTDGFASREGHNQYNTNTKHGKTISETHKLDEYDSDTEDETIKHSSRNNDNKGDKEKKIRCIYGYK
jgi:hypothetical protein